MRKKKCYIYTRVSTAAQIEGYSLEAQQERLREYAEYKGLEIAGEYCDAGKSGKSIKGRPEFLKMLDDISSEKDGISEVLVFNLSRFGRNAADILKSLQLLEDFDINPVESVVHVFLVPSVADVVCEVIVPPFTLYLTYTLLIVH